MDRLELKAMGKINLGLDVLGRRENGYHDVRMVMQTVYFYDTVVLEKKHMPGIEVKTNLFFLPADKGNLAFQAADMLTEEFKITEGISITLDKRIPVSAGMAGGSADAAAVLYGMNRMFGLGLSDEGLKKRGLKLGADVPYCIMRGTVLAGGIGEILTPLPRCPRCYVLLAKPSVNVSTKLVYERLDSSGEYEHPDIDGIIKGLEEKSIRKVASCMGNVLEHVTMKEYPVIGELKSVMKAKGALNAVMSGSGPTVFGLFEERGRAKEAADRIKELKLAKQVYVTSIHYARRNEG
ncbi:MAG: 4-(cytidine 5'-diphospho)-2-C-methyl-D-erythritol kinase [Lachnospiraceae bacterium]